MLSFLVLAGALAYLAVGVVATVVRDPQRWLKPDVYACLFIAAYVIGWIATECPSPAIRDAFATRQTFFRQFFELWLWLIVAQTWVGHGSWLFTVFMFAQIAWVAWRQRRAANRVQAVQAHAH